MNEYLKDLIKNVGFKAVSTGGEVYNLKQEVTKEEVIDFIKSLGFKVVWAECMIKVYHRDYRTNSEQIYDDMGNALNAVNEKFGNDLPFRVIGIISKNKRS